MSKKTALSDAEFSKLIIDISKPLESLKELEIETDEEAEEVIYKLKQNLNSKTEWSIRSGAITKAIQYIKGGIHYFPRGSVVPLAPVFNSLLSDLRPQCIKQALSLVAATSQVLRMECSQMLPKFIDTLDKLLLHVNPSISNAAHIAILEIAKNVMSMNYVNYFLNQWNSVEPAKRQVAVELSYIILECWHSKFIKVLKENITNICEELSDDDVPEVSVTAKKTLTMVKDEYKDAIDSTATKKVSTLLIKRIVQRNSKLIIDNIRSPVQEKFERRNSKGDNIREKADDYQSLPQGDNYKVSDIPEKKFNEPVRLTEEVLKKFNEIETAADEPLNSTVSEENNEYKENLADSVKKPEGDDPQSIRLPPMPKQSLDRFIRVHTPSHAKSLYNYLVNVIATGYLDELLAYEEELPDAVLRAVGERRSPRDWYPVLSVLFKEFNEGFKPCLIRILGLLNYDRDILELASTTYGGTMLLSMVCESKLREKSPYAFPLLCAMANANIDAQFNDQLNDFACDIFRLNKNSRHAEKIEEYIKTKQPNSPFSVIVDTVVEEIAGGSLKQENVNSFVNSLRTYIDSAAYEKKHNRSDRKARVALQESITYATKQFDLVFPQIILNNETSAKAVCNFIIKTAHKQRRISYALCVEPLLRNISDPSLPWRDTAINALAACFTDVKSLSIAFAVIERSPESRAGGLEAIYKYFRNLPPPKVAAMQQAVTAKIAHFTNNDDDEIRHNAVSILIEFQTKVASAFRKHLKKLNPALQRTIVMAAARHQRFH